MLGFKEKGRKEYVSESKDNSRKTEKKNDTKRRKGKINYAEF